MQAPTESQVSWNEHFMRMAYLCAHKSKDPSTQIGAVNVRDKLVLSTGFNGICRDVDDQAPERLVAPEKYFWFEHAERNSCFAAARHGVRLMGATMFTQDTPCADCCRSVIQSGIYKLVIHKQWSDIWKELAGNHWPESQARSSQMLLEAGIEVEVYDQILGIETLMRGNTYTV